MKTKYFTFLILLFFIGLGCQSDDNADMEPEPEFPLAEATELSSELYDIYSFVIDEMYQAERIIVRQNSQTQNYGIYYVSGVASYLEETYDNFDTSLIDIYQMVNEEAVFFGNQFYSDTKEINVITEAEFLYILENERWSGFYDRYENSNGIIYFSHVAVNEEMDQAVLEISNYGGPLAGAGNVVYLNKENGNWVINEVIGTWIS